MVFIFWDLVSVWEKKLLFCYYAMKYTHTMLLFFIDHVITFWPRVYNVLPMTLKLGGQNDFRFHCHALIPVKFGLQKSIV